MRYLLFFIAALSLLACEERITITPQEQKKQITDNLREEITVVDMGDGVICYVYRPNDWLENHRFSCVKR